MVRGEARSLRQSQGWDPGEETGSGEEGCCAICWQVWLPLWASRRRLCCGCLA